MLHARTVLLLVGLLVALGGCGSDGGTDPEPEPGVIEARVLVDAAPRSGVEVDLFAAGGGTPRATVATGADGVARFEGLEAGSYEVAVEAPAGLALAEGQPERTTVTLAAGATERVDVSMVTEAVEVVEIHLTSGLRFDPSAVTISPGTTVRWINDAAIFHTVTPDGHTEWERATLSQSGETFEHTFETEGTFDYFCEPHESAGMVGSITVE